MTRINIVPVTELTDQHLLAEYREIFMVPAALRRSLRTKSVAKIAESIPKNFTLNKGHVTFFYDKMAYLRSRYARICVELKGRGYQLTPDRHWRFDYIPPEFENQWTPTERDFEVIRRRITERIAKKPKFYTMRKQPYLTYLLTRPVSL